MKCMVTWDKGKTGITIVLQYRKIYIITYAKSSVSVHRWWIKYWMQSFGWSRKGLLGTSLVVQWLRLWPSNAGGAGSISGQGNKVSRDCRVVQLKKKGDLYYFVRQRWGHSRLLPLKTMCPNLERLLRNFVIILPKGGVADKIRVCVGSQVVS